MSSTPTARIYGEAIEVACPEGTQVVQVPGFAYPDDKPVFMVIDVKDNRAWVGPTATGNVRGFLQCSDGSESDFRIELPHLDANALPEKAPPAAPVALTYPLWFWIALGLAVAALVALLWRSVVFVRELRAAKAAPRKGKRAKAPPVPADEAFDRYLAEAAGIDEREVFGRGAERLRAYLELSLGFSAAADTTREFIASAKAALMVNRAVAEQAPEAPAQIERALLQADQVRFASERPDQATRERFVEELRRLRASVRAPAAAATNVRPAPPGRKPKGTR